MGVRDEGPNPAGKQALGRTILCPGGERKNLESMPMATSVTSRWGPEPVHWVPWRQNGASAAFGMGSALRYASGGGSDRSHPGVSFKKTSLRHSEALLLDVSRLAKYG